MPRRCSQCSNNGHNSRTCPARAPGGGGGGGVMLFGVRLSDGGSIKKSASMGNLSHYATSAQASPNPGSPSSDPHRDHDHAASGYVSDDPNHVSCSSGCRSERKKGIPWTEEEHRMFLVGLQKLGKGDWRGIARNFVVSRTPTQVASHAQKYFIRQTNVTRRKRRTSLFDMVPDTPMDTVHSTGGESEVTNSLPLLHLSLDGESKSTENASDNPFGETENLPQSNSSLMLPIYYAHVPIPCPIWPPNVASFANHEGNGEAHEVLKPTPVLPKDRVNADELAGMSKLSLSEAAAARLEPSALSLKLLGASSSRQSAFHVNSTVAGSDLSPSNSNAIHAV